jgi:hypothetical protein
MSEPAETSLGVDPKVILERWPPFAPPVFPRLFTAIALGRDMSVPLSLKRKE